MYKPVSHQEMEDLDEYREHWPVHIWPLAIPVILVVLCVAVALIVL